MWRSGRRTKMARNGASWRCSSIAGKQSKEGMVRTIQLRPLLAAYSLPERFKSEFAVLAGENLHRAHSETRVSGRGLSQTTQRQRAQILLSMAVELHDGGFGLTSPYSLRQKHIRWLVRRWVLERGMAVGSVELRLSHLRALCAWMGKAGLVGKLDDYVERPEGYQRSYVAQSDRSWTGNAVRATELIEKITQTDRYVGLQLRIEAGFGLRAQESWRLRPRMDLLPSGQLFVREGTKGGRARHVPIEFDWQYDLLVEAAQVAAQVNPGRESMIPAQYNQKQWRRRFYAVLEKHGVTKKGEGVTAHGLRHQYLQEMYERIAGQQAAVKGGGKVLDPAAHRDAMERVVSAAGHSRASKANAYLSSFHTMSRLGKPAVTLEQVREAVLAAAGNKASAAKALGISRAKLYRVLGTEGAQALLAEAPGEVDEQ